MGNIIEQWLLFKYINGEFTPFVEAVQIESTSGESAVKAPGAGAAVGSGGRDSNQSMSCTD